MSGMELRQTETFRKWRHRLKDERARALIASRLDRLAFGLAGDVEPVGKGISELRIHYGSGYRVYFQKKGDAIIVLLCGGDKSSQKKGIKTKPPCGWLKNGVNDMAKKLTAYDPAEDLTTHKAIAIFMAEAFKTSDAAYIAHALGVVARAKGMAQIAGQTGLSREQLYRTFSENGNPTLKTTLAVMKALGIELTTKAPARGLTSRVA